MLRKRRCGSSDVIVVVTVLELAMSVGARHSLTAKYIVF